MPKIKMMMYWYECDICLMDFCVRSRDPKHCPVCETAYDGEANTCDLLGRASVEMDSDKIRIVGGDV